MNSLRSLKRSVVKHKCYNRDGNTKAFSDEWERFHYNRKETVDETGESIASTKRKGRSGKKKQRHLDDGREAIDYLRLSKEFIQNKKEELKSKGDLVNG